MGYHVYTTLEERVIRQMWGEYSIHEIAEEVGVADEALRKHAIRMGLTQTGVRRPRWSRMEDAALRLMATCGCASEDIGKAIGRGKVAVQRRRRHLGV